MKRILFILLVACHTEPAKPLDPSGLPPRDDKSIPPPNPVVAPKDVDARACLRLAELACPEARSGCLSAISAARTDGVVVPSQCIAAALSVEDVRKCGDASTLRFECKQGPP